MFGQVCSAGPVLVHRSAELICARDEFGAMFNTLRTINVQCRETSTMTYFWVIQILCDSKNLPSKMLCAQVFFRPTVPLPHSCPLLDGWAGYPLL